MHTLIALSRAYSSGKITLDEVLTQLRTDAPDLFIEVPDRPKPNRVVAPKPIPKAALSSHSDPPPTQKNEEEEIIKKTRWMGTQTLTKLPSDDYANMPPLY
jgi:hypothetical protein